jgi:hypothetical protein
MTRKTRTKSGLAPHDTTKENTTATHSLIDMLQDLLHIHPSDDPKLENEIANIRPSNNLKNKKRWLNIVCIAKKKLAR